MIDILGNGNMAFAMAKAWVKKRDVRIIGRNEEKLKDFQKKLPEVDIVLAEDMSISVEKTNLVLAVKPFALDRYTFTGKANRVISVMAGVDIETISNRVQSDTYIRAMPNISALYSNSMTLVTGNLFAKEFAEDIFGDIGDVVWLDSEDELDIGTAISGSGPAYLALVASALADGGVKMGLSREKSVSIVRGLFKSFGAAIDNLSSEEIVNRVMSPKGTTSYGYSALEKGNVRYAFMQAVEEAYKRALEIGDKPHRR